MKPARLAWAALLALTFLPVSSPAEPYGIPEGRCNTAALGTVLGGALGGAIGARVADREDRPIAMFLGAAIGAIVGNAIGRDIDEADRACMGHALELAGERKTVVFSSGARGRFAR